MFLESNRIIVVDNSQDDLNKIAREFNLKGIGCRTILYDGVSFPDEPFTDVRIAFFDVNLGQAFSETDKYAILEDAIGSYISQENGPFVLIFWTNNAQWKDGFINYVNRDPESENIVRDHIRPYYISVIDKTAISERNPLERLLREQLDNQLVELCLNFDEQLKIASEKTFANLLSMVPIGDEWGRPNLFENELRKMFALIAISSWGMQNAKENPDGAINDAILPVVEYSLPQYKIWRNFINEYLMPLQSSKDIQLTDKTIPFKLNKFFLVDEKNINIKSRGAVVKLKTELFENYIGIDYLTWKKNEFGESPNLQNAFPIAVEISAACDFSQNKKRIYKYLMGIGCRQRISNNTNKKNIIVVETIIYDNQPLFIAFDFNYVLVDYEPSIIESMLFGFKKEMMDMIGNQYANHLSRIGITSFK